MKSQFWSTLGCVCVVGFIMVFIGTVVGVFGTGVYFASKNPPPDNVLTSNDFGKTKTFQRGNSFSVKMDCTLPNNDWKVLSFDKTIITLDNEEFKAEVVNQKGLGGLRPGKRIFYFSALSAGETTINMHRHSKAQSDIDKSSVKKLIIKVE